MRPNRLLPPNTFFFYEHPRLVDSRFSQSRDFRLALVGGPSVSRRPIRFGGLCGLFRVGRFLPQVFHVPQNRTSGTSVASPFRRKWRFRALFVIGAAEIVFTARP